MRRFSNEAILLPGNAENSVTRERSSKDAAEILKNSTEKSYSQSSISMSSEIGNEDWKEVDKDVSTIQTICERSVRNPMKEKDLTTSEIINIGNHSYLPVQNALDSEISNSFCIDEELTRDKQDNVHSDNDDEAEVPSLHLASPEQRSKTPKDTKGETNQAISPKEEKISRNGSQTTDSAQTGAQFAVKNAGEGTAHVESSPFHCSRIEILSICIICGFVLLVSIYVVIYVTALCLKAILDFFLITFVLSLWLPIKHQKDWGKSDEQKTDLDAKREKIGKNRKNRSTETGFSHEKKYHLSEAASEDTFVGQKDGKSGLDVLAVGVNPIIPSIGHVTSKNAADHIKIQPKNDRMCDRSSSVTPSAKSNNPQSADKANFSTRVPGTSHNKIPLSEKLTGGRRRARSRQETVESCLKRKLESEDGKPTSRNDVSSVFELKEEACDGYKSDINVSGGPVEGTEPQQQEERRENNSENLSNNRGNGASSGNQRASTERRGSNNSRTGNDGDDDDDDDENRNRQKNIDRKPEGCRRRKVKKNRQEEDDDDNNSSLERDDEPCQSDYLDFVALNFSNQLAAEHSISRQLATRPPISRQQVIRHLEALILASNSPFWLLLFQDLFSTSSRWLQNLSIITVSPSEGPYEMGNNCSQTTLAGQLGVGQNCFHATLTGPFRMNHSNCRDTLGLERIHIHSILTGQSRRGQNCGHAILTGPFRMNHNNCHETLGRIYFPSILTGQSRVGQNCGNVPRTGPSGVWRAYWSPLHRLFCCELLWPLLNRFLARFCPWQREALSWHSLPSQICFPLLLAARSHTVYVGGWVSRGSESSRLLCILPSVPRRPPYLQFFSQPTAGAICHRTYFGTRSPLLHGHVSLDGPAIHNQYALSSSLVFSESLLHVLVEISTITPLASVHCTSNSTQYFQSQAGLRNRQKSCDARFPQRVSAESCGETLAVHFSRQNKRSVYRYKSGPGSIVNEENTITEAASQQAVIGRQRAANLGAMSGQLEVASLQAARSHLVQQRDDEEDKTPAQEVTRREVHSSEMEGRPSSSDEDDSSSDDNDDDTDGRDEDEADEDAGPGLIHQFRQPCLRIRVPLTVITTPENDDEENGSSSDELEGDNLHFVHPESQVSAN